jgi:hypothetical protein
MEALLRTRERKEGSEGSGVDATCMPIIDSIDSLINK